MRTFLFLIIITTSLETQAQFGIYHPFPDSNAVWNWHFINWYCTAWTPINEEYSYTFDGDTLIGSVQYHKLVTPFVQINNPGCGRLNSVGYVGCIRHDSINKKVYCIQPNDSVEYLIFDFNLQIGDQIPTITTICFRIFTVTQIDSVLIGSTYRKRWSEGTFSIIEGIGANWEFLKPMCEIVDGASGMLTCFTQEGITLYPDSVTDCSLITNINSLANKQSSVTVFPNPFHSSMTVTLAVEKANMMIYNSLGELMQQLRISDFKTIIHRNSLTNGIYFYRISNDNDLIATGIFMVE
jgi:hypothetical protein